MKKFLVTGGAGFIGSHVVMALQDKFPDAFIIVVDNLNTGNGYDKNDAWKNLTGFKGDLIAHNVADKEWVGMLAGSTFDAVFHFASNTDTRNEDTYSIFENVEGFRGAMTIARRNKCPLIYASSAAVYGLRNEVMKETDTPTPANVYGFSKVQMDNLARLMHKADKDWPVMGLRFFNVYGPGEAHKKGYNSMVYQMYNKIKNGKAVTLFKSGEQKRDFVYIKDVVDLVLACLDKPKSGIYNCGSGKAHSFIEVLLALTKTMESGRDILPEFIDCPYQFFQTFTQADISLAKEVFGWEPKYDLEAGVKEYVKILKLLEKV